MAKLYAQDVNNIESSYIKLLAALPGTKEDKQAFFLEEKRIKIPKTNYDHMWNALVDRVRRVSAAYLVFDYLVSVPDRRLSHLLDTALSNEPVKISNKDSALVSHLFYENGNPKRICQHLLGYLRDGQGHEEVPTVKEKFESKPGQATKTMSTSHQYDVALSFAGEDRGYVELVATQLRKLNLRVFYDKFEEANLWGKDLYTHFDEIYRKKAKYCVMFLSEHYREKAWPSHERASAQARELEEVGEYILPVRLDDSEIPGIRPTIKYIDARDYSPVSLAKLIQQKCAEG